VTSCRCNRSGPSWLNCAARSAREAADAQVLNRRSRRTAGGRRGVGHLRKAQEVRGRDRGEPIATRIRSARLRLAGPATCPLPAPTCRAVRRSAAEPRPGVAAPHSPSGRCSRGSRPRYGQCSPGSPRRPPGRPAPAPVESAGASGPPQPHPRSGSLPHNRRYSGTITVRFRHTLSLKLP
jgi:hypothetical protein